MALEAMALEPDHLPAMCRWCGDLFAFDPRWFDTKLLARPATGFRVGGLLFGGLAAVDRGNHRDPPAAAPVRHNAGSSLACYDQVNGSGAVKIAQAQVGHASISTTLGIYTHVVDASHRAAFAALEDRLFGVRLRNAPKSEEELANAEPASASVD
jgi:hypothetical protein